MQVSSLHMSQGQAYRDRVVFPKITVDQNIGLYNQAMNLHQCDARDSGRLDVKSMRDTDSRSARVALFQDVSVFHIESEIDHGEFKARLDVQAFQAAHRGQLLAVKRLAAGVGRDIGQRACLEIDHALGDIRHTHLRMLSA